MNIGIVHGKVIEYTRNITAIDSRMRLASTFNKLDVKIVIELAGLID